MTKQPFPDVIALGRSVARVRLRTRGDYRVMLYSNGDDFEGETAYAKLIHELVPNHPLSA